jgi:diaminobutyrate-2-oxoglutarate transaminase
VEHAAALGRALLANLHQALSGSPLIADVRGRGLMIGVETVSGEVARRLRDTCLAQGLIFELGGRQDRVIRLLPPLVLTERQADCIVDILSRTVRSLEALQSPESLLN